MKEHSYFSQGRKLKLWAWVVAAPFLAAGLCLTGGSVPAWAQSQDGKDDEGGGVKAIVRAEQPPAPCLPNETAARDVVTVAQRGDVVTSLSHFRPGFSNWRHGRTLTCPFMLLPKR